MINRRRFLHNTTAGIGAALLTRDFTGSVTSASGEGNSGLPAADTIIEPEKRFPYFQTAPVSYMRVEMQDNFWAPRQRRIREVTVPWATSHWDKAGGLDAYKAAQGHYRAKTRPDNMEAIKFIEAMAAVVGLKRDAAIEGLIDAWSRVLIDAQGSDGYLQAKYPAHTLSAPPKPWQTFPMSHETYLIGHYLESAIAYRESTGSTALYNSALRAIDNMAGALLDGARPYISGVPEIEQALMRLYGMTGETKYLRLCAWFIAQRGHHEGRTSIDRFNQDHLPVSEQRTIEGHAVMAAYLFNGVTEYIGATGDAAYREAVLAVWDDLVEHKMYLQGAAGSSSAMNEGYKAKPYSIPPGDTYGESCAVVANFQWAHNLFRLTGDARYIDVAERMLYNVFYATLSLHGDRFFYKNVSQLDDPTLRFDWHACPCCPPNIVKLFCKVGGYFYSTDNEGIYVKHYGASQADIPFRDGVKLIQRGDYPWNGDITLQVKPNTPAEFAVRLRIPAWAESHKLSINGSAVQGDVRQGWVEIRRRWTAGDRIELSLPMPIKRVTMPPEFKDYKGLVAFQRGPIVYCVEEQDSVAPVGLLYVPDGAEFEAEHRADLLGGITVLRTALRQNNILYADVDPVPVMLIPYGVWANRLPGPMRIWMPTKNVTAEDFMAQAAYNPLVPINQVSQPHAVTSP